MRASSVTQRLSESAPSLAPLLWGQWRPQPPSASMSAAPCRGTHPPRLLPHRRPRGPRRAGRPPASLHKAAIRQAASRTPACRHPATHRPRPSSRRRWSAVRLEWTCRRVGIDRMVLGVYRSSVWSTRVDLVVTDPGVIVEASRLLNQTLDRVDAVASRFRSGLGDQRAAPGRRTGSPGGRSAPISSRRSSVALRAARLTDGAVDPTVGAAMCRLGYDRDFSMMAADVAGELPEPGPVPGWRSVDPRRRALDGDTARRYRARPRGHGQGMGRRPGGPSDRVTSGVRCAGLAGWGHHRRRSGTRRGVRRRYRRHLRRPCATDHRVHRVGGPGHLGDRKPSLDPRRPPRPPPARSGDRPSRGHALENGVGGRRILRRRQHGVDGGHGHG